MWNEEHGSNLKSSFPEASLKCLIKFIVSIKKLLFIFFCCNTFLYAQSIQASCIFYIGANNKLTCLGIKNIDPEGFTTSNGYVDKNPYYRPMKTGTTKLEYKGQTYLVEVKSLPDTKIVFQSHLKDSVIAKQELIDGIRVVPYLPDIPFDVYMTMKQVQYSLLNSMKKGKKTLMAAGSNFIRLINSDLTGVEYIRIDYAMVVVSGLEEQKVNCNTIISIK